MNIEIHRLLDDAFAGIPMTPEIQDLKEEIRANLASRAAELEAAGRSPHDAAERALAELGDVRDLTDPDMTKSSAEPTSETVGQVGGRAFDWTRAASAHRVRPKPGFVIRTVLLSVAAAAALAAAVIAMTPLVSWPGPGIALALVFGSLTATLLGVVTADSLTQETTTNHGLPPGRAVAFGAATLTAIAALAWGAAFGRDVAGHPAHDATSVVIIAAALLVVALVLFAWLGATKTNRHKAWTRRAAGAMPVNAFETRPETAARFGIYTGAIWIVALVVAGVLALTVGWQWSPLPVVGGIAATLITLARMTFPPRAERASPAPGSAQHH